jgi:hypothetical protein
MRPSAIASLGGACLLLAATAAVGSTTTSSSLSKPPAADQPPATATASGPQSDSNGQYYRQRNDRSGKSQNKSISDRRPAFQRGTYVLQHPDDWAPGAYFSDGIGNRTTSPLALHVTTVRGTSRTGMRTRNFSPRSAARSCTR